MRYKKLLLSAACAIIAASAASAQSLQKKIEPGINFGIGMYVPYGQNYNDGISAELSATLEVRLNDSWSLMGSIGTRDVAEWDDLKNLDGADTRAFSFIDAGISLRYHFMERFAVGLGPCYSWATDRDVYYIDADPNDPLFGEPVIKKGGYGIRPSFDYYLSRHWKVGAIANIGLCDMLEDHGQGGSLRISSVMATVGFRF